MISFASLFVSAITYSIKWSSIISTTGPKKSRNDPPNCIILDSWALENFTLADELFVETLRFMY